MTRSGADENHFFVLSLHNEGKMMNLPGELVRRAAANVVTVTSTVTSTVSTVASAASGRRTRVDSSSHYSDSLIGAAKEKHTFTLKVRPGPVVPFFLLWQARQPPMPIPVVQASCSGGVLFSRCLLSRSSLLPSSASLSVHKILFLLSTLALWC